MTREKLLEQIQGKLNKQQHVLLVGPLGAGKSWLLHRVQPQLRGEVIQLSMSLARKALIMAILERMFVDGKELGFEAAGDWGEAKKEMRGEVVDDLLDRIRDHLGAYTFILDDLERATEKVCIDVVTHMLNGRVIAAADLSTPTLRKRSAAIINNFHRINVPALTVSEAQTMLWSLLDREEYSNPKLLETQFWNNARGRPGVVADLVEQLGDSKSLRDVRALHHSAPDSVYVGLLPFLLYIGLIGLVSLRYVSRGFDDPYVYMFGAIGFTVLRLFINPLQKWADG